MKHKRTTPSILRMTIHLALSKYLRHSNTISINKLKIHDDDDDDGGENSYELEDSKGIERV